MFCLHVPKSIQDTRYMYHKDALSSLNLYLHIYTFYKDDAYTLSYMIHTRLAAGLCFPEKIIQVLFPHDDQGLGGVAQGHGGPGPGGGGEAGARGGQAEVGQGHGARPAAHVGGGGGRQGQREVRGLGERGARPEASPALREDS